MKEWRKRLSAFRDEHLTREPPASQNEDEGRPDRAALLRELGGLSEPKLDEWMQEASRKDIDLIDDLRRAAWRAKREAEDDPAEVGRAHFLWALHHPVVLNGWRLAVKQWLREQRAG